MLPYKEQETTLFNSEFTLLKKRSLKILSDSERHSHITNIFLHRQNSFLGEYSTGQREHRYRSKCSVGPADLVFFNFWKLAYN